MNLIRTCFIAFLLLIGLSVSPTIFAQTKQAIDWQADLISPWLVTVQGESRVRTLTIKGVAQKPDGGLLLEATYGYSDAGQTPISASVSVSGETVTLSYVSQMNSKAVSQRTSDGSFEGTITYTNGKAMSIRLVKVSENELREATASAQSAYMTSAVTKPSAYVPAACAAFAGVWTGVWPIAGPSWLWITEINSKCIAKYAYSISPRVPNNFQTAEIKGSTLSIPRPDGATTFTLRDENNLSGHYSGARGENDANLTKVEASANAITQLRAAQLENLITKVTPPTPDVPAACASFFGSWVGTWSQGNIPEQKLQVIEVNAKCIAKYTYASAKLDPKNFQTAEIKEGSLSFACNPSTGGTCVFQHRGGSLSASYSNPGGGNNSATFQKATY